MDLQTAYRSARPAEVTFDASVTGTPTFFYGTHTHCMHEEFPVRTASGPVDVIDNVDIAPRVNVALGDRVQVRGELVHRRDGSPPIVHWTHHDPGGRHADGFIQYRGRRYA